MDGFPVEVGMDCETGYETAVMNERDGDCDCDDLWKYVKVKPNDGSEK